MTDPYAATADSSSPFTPARLPSAARWAVRLLSRVEHGAVRIQFPDRQVALFGRGTPVDLHVHEWRMFERVLRGGDVGFAESYLDGDWSASDLPGLIALCARNRRALEAAVYGRWLGRIVHVLRHLRNRNTRGGSRRNIHAHYDLGNAFYALWLDPGMTYSSAWFGGDAARPLAQAQQAKFDRVLEEATAGRSGCRVLEIGCGWGGLAETAARAGHTVHGVTLSTEQLAWARDRIAASGLADRASFDLCDYRDLGGRYDAIVSIEMVEAVGESYWPDYFQVLHDRLAVGGRACVQSIVIDHTLFDRYRRSSDFIQQYVFPGGMLPSAERFRAEAARAGLEVTNELAFGLDYARTLAYWRASFHERLDEVRALGFDDRFVRLWDFYLAYCEAGFAAGNTDVIQFTLSRVR